MKLRVVVEGGYRNFRPISGERVGVAYLKVKVPLLIESIFLVVLIEMFSCKATKDPFIFPTNIRTRGKKSDGRRKTPGRGQLARILERTPAEESGSDERDTRRGRSLW